MIEQLQDRWNSLWQRLGIDNPATDGFFDSLVAHYNGSGRYYHNLDHLNDVMEKLDWAKDALHSSGETAQMDSPARQKMFDTIELALWYHDIIYDPHAKDNEEQSRILFVQHMQQLDIGQDIVTAAAHLIDITAHHKNAATLAERILTDCDLAVFGGDAAAFKKYDDNIGREYSFVPPEIYNTLRPQVLEGFLKQHQIFKTAAFRDKYEQAANDNLKAILQAYAPKTGAGPNNLPGYKG